MNAEFKLTLGLFLLTNILTHYFENGSTGDHLPVEVNWLMLLEANGLWPPTEDLMR